MCRFPRLLALAAALLPAGPAAADRWVDAAAGSDGTNDCRRSSEPCRTIRHALSNVSLPRERVLVRPGVYSAGEVFPLALPDGAELVALEGPDVTVIRDEHADPTEGRTVILTVSGGASFKGIEGFTVDGAGLAANEHGVYVESFAPRAAPPDPPYVRGLRVQGYARSGVTLVTWGCCSGETTGLGAVVERNLVLGSGAVGLTVVAINEDAVTRAVDESVVRNNVVLGGDVGVYVASLPGAGGANGNGELRTVLRHNTVVQPRLDGVFLSSEGAGLTAGPPVVDVEVANNVIVAAGGYGIHEFEGTGLPPLVRADARALVANLLFGNALGNYFDADTLRAYTAPAELAAIPDLVGRSSLNLVVPAEVDPTSGRVPLASPARDAGAPDFSAPEDVEGQRRPAGPAPDIGADEVVALRRGAFRALDPPEPAKEAVFGALAEYRAVGPSPYIDPDGGVLVDERRPLVVYAFDPAYPVVLRLVKEPASESVRIAY